MRSRPLNRVQFSDAAGRASATILEQEGFGIKRLNKDGHLITEDSVLPTTAPGGAPERNRCYQTPAILLVLPLAPASLARSAHLAPLTTLRPRWGLALFEWLRLQQKGFHIVEPSGPFTAVAKLCKDRATAF
jgi:hypothetical protein